MPLIIGIMRQNSLSIHSENILPIIKKLRVLQGCDQAATGGAPFAIHVKIDRGNKTLTISDNGIGMTEEEVEKYIAQIAFSGAEDFLAKYKSQSANDPMIGHFGLGFYSSYMVAAKVSLETLSYQPSAKPVAWSCDGSSTYEIGLGTRQERGTDVILHLDDVNAEYLEEAKIRELLDRYCVFMPDPIDLNGTPLGNQAPLWI